MKKMYQSPSIKLVEFNIRGQIMTEIDNGDIIDNSGLHDWTETSGNDDLPTD